MIRRLIVAALLAVSLFPSVGLAASHHPKASAASAELAQFDTEAAAQAHCPGDHLVSLNMNSGTYHEKGMRWYGRTKHGACACRKAADATDERDTRNGQ